MQAVLPFKRKVVTAGGQEILVEAEASIRTYVRMYLNIVYIRIYVAIRTYVRAGRKLYVRMYVQGTGSARALQALSVQCGLQQEGGLRFALQEQQGTQRARAPARLADRPRRRGEGN